MCSKAEQFYDLNLDLYVPHVATPKPPEPDQDEEDDFIRPVSTQKPLPPTTTTTTTPRTTTSTTTYRSTTTTRTTTPRRAPASPSSTKSSNSVASNSPNKGFSSFNYYLKTPHSHVSSGYNSQSQQSYIFNHNPTSGEKEDGSYTVSGESESQGSESTARKIPSGPKTIVYGVSSSSTVRPRGQGQPHVTPSPVTTTPKSRTPPPPPLLKPEEYEEQYGDEYYDDVDYELSSTTGSGSTPTGGSSQPKSYAAPLTQSQRSNKNLYQPQGSSYSRGKVSGNSYDYRDGRSASISDKSDRDRGSNSNKGSETKSHVSVAFSSSSKSTRSPPTVTGKVSITPRPGRFTTTTKATTTTRRPLPKTTPEPEPYYYEDDYPDDAELQMEQEQEPMIIVKSPHQVASTTLRTVLHQVRAPPPGKNILQEQTGPSGSDGTGPSGSGLSGDNPPEYYDDGDGAEPVNVNDHHFSHVDVPRIPFAKPNVPRVLVTK